MQVPAGRYGRAWDDGETRLPPKLDPLPPTQWLEARRSDDPSAVETCTTESRPPGRNDFANRVGFPSSAAPPQTGRRLACKTWVEEMKSGQLSYTRAPGMTACAFLVSNSVTSPDPAQAAPSQEDPVKDSEDNVAVLHSSRHASRQDGALSELLHNFDSFDPECRAALDSERVPTHETWIVKGGLADVGRSFAEVKDSLALEFPFELDIFQKEAICNLEMGRSVFVAAHTSAGKTVVAEYALALAQRHCTRAVYTSPIKTISNQKFRDFSSKFEVGIMTGDTQINPHASCLVLTTEILRSMLYKGADLTRDMEFVIFDEVHYVNDPERGVVWEETIIMLPPHVQVILLSATVPNVEEFASWVGRTRQTKVYISGTNKRPVPLQHHLYYSGKLFCICRGDQFLSEGYRASQIEQRRKNEEKQLPPRQLPSKTAAKSTEARGGVRGGRRGRGRGRHISDKAQDSMMHFVNRQLGPNSGTTSKSNQTQLKALLTALEKKSLFPAVVFAFSKKVCDDSAFFLGSVDLTTSAEVHEIHVFIEKSLTRLAEADRSVPQILQMKAYLKRGIGVHHAGLLPIMKEVVEMLFCRGLLKVLFATETFAMGVNAPARSVVFHSLKKHDGQEFRTLLPGEYTQMAGRAGRRGLDEVGTVVIACWEAIPEETMLRSLMRGRGVVLSSRFRLTYSMIMNLMRVDDLKVEEMLKRSFAEFHAQKAVGHHRQKIERCEAVLKTVKLREWPECKTDCTKAAFRQYCDLHQRLKRLGEKLMPHLMGASKVQKLMLPGKVVLLFDQHSGLVEMGVVVADSEAAQKPPGKKSNSTVPTPFTVLTLHTTGPWDSHCLPEPNSDPEQKEAGFMGKKLLKTRSDSEAAVDESRIALPAVREAGTLHYKIAEVGPEAFVHFSTERLRLNTAQILKRDEPHLVLPLLTELTALKERDFEFADLKVWGDIDVTEALQERQHLLESLLAMPPHSSACRGEKYAQIHTEKYLEMQIAVLRHRISDAALRQMPEFGRRLEVLRHFGYVDEMGTVQLKGRVACEINSGDELIITEMIFRGVLTHLSPEEGVAVLSSFIFQEKNNEMPELIPSLAEACEALREICIECGLFQFECGLGLDPESYFMATLNFGLVNVVHEWAKGTSFVEICQLTDVPEGTIVRTIVRLEQSCREVMDAARVMGNTALFQQMQQASLLIKRDVIFAASLYVTL